LPVYYLFYVSARSQETEGSHRVTVISDEGTTVLDSAEASPAVSAVAQPAARKKSNLVAAMSTSNTNALSGACAAAASSFSLQSNGSGAAELTAALGNSEMTRRAAAIGAVRLFCYFFDQVFMTYQYFLYRDLEQLEVNERSENDAIDLDFDVATESQQGDIFSKTWVCDNHC
jgi:hypothetical protein